ncbi:hypothetical protein [Telluria aromaticivorans]|uniref:Uncharacterized protein n=1 Tax=Telluria aromaticivorans TaxID=2725995 RepID=A0A7Y2JVU1_9BURK|nr:hypothetical protein [Telluria aromaticivorans]NNG21975.1 hypothetical protein [Telluria aromaticivorans]
MDDLRRDVMTAIMCQEDKAVKHQKAMIAFAGSLLMSRIGRESVLNESWTGIDQDSRLGDLKR